MTDNEIIKALECSPLNDIGGCRKIDALDLINRQKAKIEFLKEQRDIYMKDATEFSKKIERLSNLVNEKNVINKWLLEELSNIAETESD